MNKPKPPCILYISTYPPRECGIATFCKDTIDAFDKEFGDTLKTKVLAVNDNGTSIYNYPRKVSMQMYQSEMVDYLNKATQINNSPEIKLVNIQHEYGIFGGDWGDYLLPFMELIQKPIILTMHTVLPKPHDKLKTLTKAITDKAAAITVMTKTSANILEKVYGVPKSKINIVPHGVHNISFPSKSKAKKKLNLEGKTILSTFGMLNRDKGIEYAIEALPEIVAKHPNVMYLVLGATHPVVRREEGEVYRNKLKRIVIKNKLQDHVKFYDKYLTIKELIEFLKATDVYISPTLNPKQAVSGTISYALSCACPIVATKNQYAKDVLDSSRGYLVKFKNSLEIKNALADVLGDSKARKEMGKNSYFYSRHMTFQNTAIAYFKLYNQIANIVPRNRDKLPEINMQHIRTLTDKFGMIQFAQHTRPDIHSGYCLDDNARALLGCVEYHDTKKSNVVLGLINTYFNFVKITEKSNKKFYNLYSYQRTPDEDNESEDSYGRGIWSLGYVINSKRLPEDMKKQARSILRRTIDSANNLNSLRAVSFTIIGLSEALEKDPNKHQLEIFKRLSEKLVRKFNQQLKDSQDENWAWFEDCLTYSNYKLSEAMFRAYKITENPIYLEIAERSIQFLNKITFEGNGHFSPIGQDGWYFRTGKRAYFDQQPEDASSAVEALVVAYQITGNKDYKAKAELAFQWFLGKNHLNQMVYDENTGGCYDGLGRYSLNFNQGAESTLSYFLARLAIEKISKPQ